MQVFRYWDLIHLNIVCVQVETVLSLIRANWMLWSVRNWLSWWLRYCLMGVYLEAFIHNGNVAP